MIIKKILMAVFSCGEPVEPPTWAYAELVEPDLEKIARACFGLKATGACHVGFADSNNPVFFKLPEQWRERFLVLEPFELLADDDAEEVSAYAIENAHAVERSQLHVRDDELTEPGLIEPRIFYWSSYFKRTAYPLETAWVDIDRLMSLPVFRFTGKIIS